MSLERLSVRGLLAIVMAGGAIAALTLPGTAQEKTAPVLTVRERDRPSTAVKEWIAQVEAAIVRVTVDRTAQGLQVVLETESGQTLQATQREEGDSLLITVPNAVLALSNGQAFAADKPAEGISRVTVSQADATSIQIRITGLENLPTAEVVSGQGLVLAVTPEIGEEEEITVTGEGQRGYRVPNASTATRTDTPIRDIPQSIQVVPQEVLRDRNVRSITEAVETVSGVVDGGQGTFRIIRGFTGEGSAAEILRNGYRVGDGFSIVSEEPPVTIEQIEVLKGPASVLFGALEPGGIVNTITKQPLRDPYYKFAFEAGNRGFYQPSIDLSGPLTDDKTLLYRFIAAYKGTSGFFESSSTSNTLIAPSITLNLGERTNLNLYYEYSKFAGNLFDLYRIHLGSFRGELESKINAVHQ